MQTKINFYSSCFLLVNATLHRQLVTLLEAVHTNPPTLGTVDSPRGCATVCLCKVADLAKKTAGVKAKP